MKFSELVRLLEQNGFRIIKEKGSIRYYGKPCVDRLIRVEYYWLQRSADRNLQCYSQDGRPEIGRETMINLKYSLVIEATDDPTFFGFFSPDLEGFTGIGHSIEDCLYKAKWGIKEHVALLKEQGLPIPKENPNPKVTIQNEERLAKAV